MTNYLINAIKLYFCDKYLSMEKEINKMLAIINPISGVGSKDRVAEVISSRCAEKGISLNITFTEYAGHAMELTQRAIDNRVDCIVAVGGDGTVNEVARNLLYSEVVLGIIPRGSGNGLARELRIPMDVRGAVEVVFSNHISVIDACKANDYLFFCTCGVGFDAAVSAEFAKAKRRGSLTYLKEVIQSYLDYKPETYILQINDSTIKEEAFLITCANASQYGNNAFIAPNADISDGQMDVAILSPFNALDIGTLTIQLFTKTIDKNSKIKIFRSKEAKIIRQQAGVMHIDGDPVMADKDIKLSVLNSALHVIAPENISFAEGMYRRINEIFSFFEERIGTIHHAKK